jgi:DNA-binding transcriptional MerR regulator
MRDDAHEFPTPLAVQLTGVLARDLMNWSNRAFLRPSIRAGSRGHADARVYNFRDLVAIRVVDELRQRGLEVRHLRAVVAHVRNREDIGFDRDIPAHRLLITDGHTFVQLDDNVRVRAAELCQSGQPPKALLLVPLGAIVNKLQADARALGLCAA